MGKRGEVCVGGVDRHIRKKGMQGSRNEDEEKYTAHSEQEASITAEDRTRHHFQSKLDTLRMAADQGDKRQRLPDREGSDGSRSIALTTATLASHPSAWK